MNGIRDQISAAALATLDRMADKQFMQPVIEFGDCWEVETSQGETFVVPSDVEGIPSELADDATTDDDATLTALTQYLPEGCGGYVLSATVRRDIFLARMSAPGYMDCTDWEMHDTAQEAADSLIENYDEGEGDEGDGEDEGADVADDDGRSFGPSGRPQGWED